MKSAATNQTAAVLALCAALITQPLAAQQQAPLAGTPQPPAGAIALPIDRGAAATWQSLQKLKTRATMLTINAHPDDEDGSMVAYESRGHGVESSLFALTRGEGGQNVMSNDYWDQLGILRTQELLAATEYEGTHLYFGRFADYGFSKTIEEAFKNWGHERVLYDSVRIVRILRPMVITSSFNGNVADGHGHHQVAGEMAQEVFKAAGDPNVFPDQIKAGLHPWSPLKVYARAPFTRVTDKGIYDSATDRWSPAVFRNYTNDTEIHGSPNVTVQIPSGSYNPLLASSYASIAREGLAQQRSQNGGVATPTPGPSSSAYHLWNSRVTKTLPEHENDFFDGIDTSIAGMASYLPQAEQSKWRARLEELSASIDDAASHFNAADPSTIAHQLAKGLKQTRSLIADLKTSSLPEEAKFNITHELQTKEHQFNDALTNALGLSLIASVQGGGGRGGDGNFLDAISGQKFTVRAHITNQGNQPVGIGEATVITPNRLLTVTNLKTKRNPNTFVEGQAYEFPVPPNEVSDQDISIDVPEDIQPTKPYFTRQNLEQSIYDISIPEYLALPTSPYPFVAIVGYKFDGVYAGLKATVQTQHRYNGPGTVFEPLLVAPAISVTISPEAGIVPISNASLTLKVTVHSSVKGPAKGELKLQLPAGWLSKPAIATFSTMRDGDEQNITFQVTPEHVQAKPYTLSAIATYNGKEYKQGFVTTGYVGIRPYPSYREASYRTTGTDVKIAPNLRVAYIAGTGDDVPKSLEDLGVHVTFLSAQDIASADLSTYDAIVLGIRTYAARPDLRTFNHRLLEYVQNGGTVINQYQNGQFNENYAPYPLSVPTDAERVVNEDDKVTILAPNDPVLSWPNKITTADFDNWVEERGHGFATTWDAKYVALTEMHDPEEDPQKGGLLYARYGKGTYVYMAFAFFRQMPDGVPGSFRIMANLLSIGKNPQLK